MPRPSYKIISWLMLLSVLFITGQAFAWHDKTHLAISQAAGYEHWYNSAGPDVTKTKAGDKKKQIIGSITVTKSLSPKTWYWIR